MFYTCYNDNCARIWSIHAKSSRKKLHTPPCVFIIQCQSYLFVKFYNLIRSMLSSGLHRSRSGKAFISKVNKHCKNLMSCSYKETERNCIQAHETACKLMELYVSSLNYMKAHGTAGQVRELCASFCNCMQAYVMACKLMDLHAFWNILELSAFILECSGKLM